MNAFDYPEEPTKFSTLVSITDELDVADETAAGENVAKTLDSSGHVTDDATDDATDDKSAEGELEKQRTARCQVLYLATAVGSLCAYMNTYAPLDPKVKGTEQESLSATMADDVFWSDETSPPERDAIYNAIGTVFASVFILSEMCAVDLRQCILKKIELDSKKNPAPKKTVDANAPSDETVKGIQKLVQDFAVERKLEKKHTPRNLVMAIMGALGNLTELFQFRGDDAADYEDGENEGLNWEAEDMEQLKQRIAQVAIYCLRLADVVGIQDLGFITSMCMQYGGVDDGEDEVDGGDEYDVSEEDTVEP